MTVQFTKATKKQARLRMALIGPSGSGKTYTALSLAGALGKRVAVVDTEHGSASKYSDIFAFDVLELETFSPKTYTEAIRAAGAAGYDVLVIDSLSHAWMGTGGALELVDQAAARNRGENRFTAWKDVTPLHNELVNTIIQSPLHVIATMRSKTDYVMEEYTDSQGRKKSKPVKVGLAPIQRDGVEYEFDIVADIDLDHKMIVSKSRMFALSGAVILKPGPGLAADIAAWLTDGQPVAAVATPPIEPPGTNGHPKADPPPVQAPKQAAPAKKATVKPAEVKFRDAKRWNALCGDLVAAHPHYAKDGKPNVYHITLAATKAGFPVIDDANMESVIEAIASRAAELYPAGGAVDAAVEELGGELVQQ